MGDELYERLGIEAEGAPVSVRKTSRIGSSSGLCPEPSTMLWVSDRNIRKELPIGISVREGGENGSGKRWGGLIMSIT